MLVAFKLAIEGGHGCLEPGQIEAFLKAIHLNLTMRGRSEAAGHVLALIDDLADISEAALKRARSKGPHPAG